MTRFRGLPMKRRARIRLRSSVRRSSDFKPILKIITTARSRHPHLRRHHRFRTRSEMILIMIMMLIVITITIIIIIINCHPLMITISCCRRRRNNLLSKRPSWKVATGAQPSSTMTRDRATRGRVHSNSRLCRKVAQQAAATIIRKRVRHSSTSFRGSRWTINLANSGLSSGKSPSSSPWDRRTRR